MSFEEKNHICDDAELYYLALIFGEEYGNVPKQIAAHVESCGYCKSRLEALKDLLAADDSEDNQLSNAQIDMLGLQFAYLGKKVDCAIVKPFLPSILEPYLAVKIPTPITVHIDRCDLCKNDLAVIRSMALNAKQLNVLSSILGNDPSVETVDCSVAASALKQYVELDWDKIEPDVAKHLCCCNVCQSLIYKLRAETIIYLRESNVQTTFPCESVTFSDVFDYCYPYGLVPYRDQYANFRKPFVDELKQCAECLQKVQDLHRLVYSVKQRLNSGIVTIYEMGESQKSEAATDINEVYEGFPVKVRAIEPIGKQSKSESEQDNNNADFRSRAAKKWLKHIARAAVAAGIILAVSLFLLNTPTATALTIQQVYDAIKNAANINIKKFSPESAKPLQEKWVSKTLGIYAVKDENGFVAWNVPNELKYTKLSGFQGTETVSMTEIQSASIQKRIKGSLGLMPFENVSQVPVDARWQTLDTSELKGIPANTQVYELSWTKQTEGQAMIRIKWRGFIEKSTNRPLRTEFYRYNKNSGEYELETIDLIEYCTENQIRELLP